MAKKRIKEVEEIKKMTAKDKNIAKWYAKPENKKHMSEYMKKYNKKNKVKLRNYQKEKKYDKPAKNRIATPIIAPFFQASGISLRPFKFTLPPSPL